VNSGHKEKRIRALNSIYDYFILLYRDKDLTFMPISLTQRPQQTTPRPKCPAKPKTGTKKENAYHHPWRQNGIKGIRLNTSFRLFI